MQQKKEKLSGIQAILVERPIKIAGSGFIYYEEISVGVYLTSSKRKMNTKIIRSSQKEKKSR